MRDVIPALVAALALLTATAAIERDTYGVLLPVGDRWLKVEPCADAVIRVAYVADRDAFARPSLAAAPKRCGDATWTVSEVDAAVVITTAALQVRVETATGAVTFLRPDGTPILREADRTLAPAIVQGERTFSVRQRWHPRTDEALYGLGQHQLGLMDVTGYDIDLWQHNVTASVPVLVSSAGYGIFWDNPSLTRFGDLRPFEPIPPDRVHGADGVPGGFTGSYFAARDFTKLVATRQDPRIDIEIPGGTPDANTRIHPELPASGDVSVRWEGEIEAPSTGDYQLRTFSQAGVKLWVDDRLVIDHWRQGWLPWFDVAKVRFEAGRRYRLRLEWTKDQGIETMRLEWKTPAPDRLTSLWSEVGDAIDYYFLYGPSLDAVIAGYRRVTGEAPMMPRWALGYFQSRERYATAQESLDVLDGFRTRNLPIDVIVQDWQYWKPDAWGSHAFDESRFPDPDAWIKAVHDRHRARLMISVWGKFYPGTANFDALRAAGALYEAPLGAGMIDWLGHPYTFYDAFSEKGRALFWSQLDRDLFRRGVDAWWMDATEPDIVQPMPTLAGQKLHMHPAGGRTAARVLNAYTLVNSQAVYDGQRASDPDRRVFILTRSAYAGQQRYAAAAWSGDVTSTWTAFRKQIPAGLSFSLSGLPYWTMDIGGFSVPPRFAAKEPSAEDAEEWREMNVRWFQYGAFCPIFRSHGQSPPREPWQFGGDGSPAYRAMAKFSRLRYRLLPYVYSLAAGVTHAAGTIMRPLVMDFPDDARARGIGDQYMFGPSLMASPVTEYRARTRAVYLPPATWYDFWTGRPEAGRRALDAAAPLDTMPVHVRAGAILPLGPSLQYTNEKPPDPIHLLVYAGADGAFTLYEDDGETFAYERGAAARIPIRWSDAERRLTIGAREGRFDGMLPRRTFEVVLVSPRRPVGYPFDGASDRTVAYSGEVVEVVLR